MGIKTVGTRGGALGRVLESDIQKSLFEMIGHLRTAEGLHLIDFTYAVPNGTMFAGTPAQRAQYSASLKAQGLKPGVSDVVIALPRGQYHGAYIELKRDDKTPVTDEQRVWLARMESVGYYTALAIGFDDALAHVQHYLKQGPFKA